MKTKTISNKAIALLISAATVLLTAPALGGDKSAERSAACAAEPTLAEQAICLDRGLTRLDGELNRAYSELKSISTAKQFKAVKAEQLDWLEERNSCGSDVSCLNDKYTDRIAVLEQAQENLAYSGTSHNDIGSAELSCAIQSKLNSPTKAGERVSVTFVNKSEGYRGVMWLDFNGTPKEYGNIDKGQSYTVDTFAGHIWMFTDGPGNCIELYTAKSGQSLFNVTAKSPGFGAGHD